jgi:hypothetical protein
MGARAYPAGRSWMASWQRERGPVRTRASLRCSPEKRLQEPNAWFVSAVGPGGPGTTPCLPLWLPACAMVATASVHTGTIAQTQKRGWAWAECYSILILLGQWYYGFKIPSVFLKIIGGLNFVNRPVSTKSDRLVDKSTENQEEKPESTVVL